MLNLEKTKTYYDPTDGNVEKGIITIQIGDEQKQINWNWFQNNTLRWMVDPVIREEFLGEDEAVMFIRL